MTLGPNAASNTDPSPVTNGGRHINAQDLQGFVMALFFMLGGKAERLAAYGYHVRRSPRAEIGRLADWQELGR